MCIYIKGYLRVSWLKISGLGLGPDGVGVQGEGVLQPKQDGILGFRV